MALVLAWLGGRRPASVVGGIGSLQELIGLGGIPNAARSYVRGQAINYLARAGHSANSILSQLSEAGLGIRRSQGLQMIRTTRSHLASQSVIGSIPLDAGLGAAVEGGPPDNWTGQYFHQVTMTWRSRDEGGNYVLHKRTIGYNADSILTGEQAVNTALSIISEPTPMDEESRYPMAISDVLAISVSGIWYDTQGRGRRR